MLTIILIILVVILLSYRDLIDAVVSFDMRTFDNFADYKKSYIRQREDLKHAARR
jgi:hypothetical protein